ncbi:MAG: FHA domain-containing protein [Aggregatilineales bacterium]
MYSKTAELTIKTQHNFKDSLEKALNTAASMQSSGTNAHSLLLYIRDAQQPLVIDGHACATLGRRIDPDNDAPDYDLTPYGALEKGVSRLHAMIDCTQGSATITDMGSTNGVFLNGRQILPKTRQPLNDGDELQFGRLVAHIYFE